ncbi:MAG: hypothetical protein K8R92_03440 [Planctomycetes bacterium]|nr:hypothetical protein [Planctomycetota bacterium]
MTAASDYLLSLGRQVLEPYARLPGVACAALTGSSAEGLSDLNSDLDSTVYYDTMPPEAEILALRERVGGGPALWKLGSHADGEFVESFRIRGVECQIGHTTVERWEKDMERTLAGEDPASPLHKAMSGTLVSIAVFGDDRLEQWKKRLRDYPEVLRVAMVKHHLKFFALWGVLDRLEIRDANLWIRQSLVESSFNLIGIAAGLSCKYFTSFQYKRSAAFIRSMEIAPERLYERLERLWTLPTKQAVQELRTLVHECVQLVEREFPQVDTSACRRSLDRNDLPWTMSADVPSAHSQRKTS